MFDKELVEWVEVNRGTHYLGKTPLLEGWRLALGKAQEEGREKEWLNIGSMGGGEFKLQDIEGSRRRWAIEMGGKQRGTRPAQFSGKPNIVQALVINTGIKSNYDEARWAGMRRLGQDTCRTA